MNSVTHKFIRKIQKIPDLSPNFDWEDIISCYTPPSRHHIHFLLQFLIDHNHNFDYKNKTIDPTKAFILAGYTPPTIKTPKTPKESTVTTLSTKQLTQRILQLENIIQSLKL